MATSLVLDISDDLAEQLRPVSDRLTRILELGLREYRASSENGFNGMAEVLEFLASLPAPEDILALCPSVSLQARISYLLDRNRTPGLTPAEAREWEQYQYLEHVVRIAKLNAHLKLASA